LYYIVATPPVRHFIINFHVTRGVEYPAALLRRFYIYDSMVDRKQFNDSLETLTNRYSNPGLLKAAALRRAHLNYNRISFGRLNGQKKYLRLLLSQAHTAYYIGSFHACIALCGCLLEALLQIKIKKELKEKGKIMFYFYFQGKKIEKIETKEDIEKLTFNDMINLAKNKRFLNREQYIHLCNIKEIRNQALHEKLIPFVESKNGFSLSLHKNIRPIHIVLEREEVADLKDDGFQITAYYCLSRMRRIFRTLIY
jgi:hypothetical protein